MNINPQTRCLGILGHPLGHSLSPLLHNRTLQHLNLNYVYLPFEVDLRNLKDAVASVRVLGMAGVNVTIPFKEAVIPFLDELSPESSICQSVNVIVNRAGKLVGHNTDGAGFMQALSSYPVQNGCAVLIGCGGASRAIACQLAGSGWERLVLLDINLRRAESLADFLRGQYNCEFKAMLMGQDRFEVEAGAADLVVNCTPMGMYPHIEGSPVDSLQTLQPGALVCDIIYNPQTTRLLKMAQQAGLATVDGLSMFVNQAALSLELWLGVKPPLEFMKGVALDGLR